MSSKSFSYNQYHLLKKEINASVCMIEIPDIFIEKIIIQEVVSTFSDEVYEKKYGNELNINWIEDNIYSPGLFSSTNFFLILESDKMPKSVIEKLSEGELGQGQKVVFLHVGAPKKALLKNKIFSEAKHIKLNPPKFWENSIYLETFAHFFSFSLSHQSKQHILSCVEGNPQAYFNAISLLSPHIQEGYVDDMKVKSLIRPGFLDNFKLSDFFNSGNVKAVWKSLLVIESDFNEFRSFFAFMQGHILKAMDTSYLASKKKLSKYDQGIKLAERRWSTKQLNHYLSLFSDLEVMAKLKDSFLRDRLRENFLKS